MDTSSLTAKLSEDLADIPWTEIKPHAQRDAVIVVNDGLSMVEVGVAIASDQVDKVQHWIAEALVQKPSAEQLSLWNDEPTLLFSTLIVQPYVLISGQRSETPATTSN